MKEERMKVLNMVGDDKIDADGAQELLLVFSKLNYKEGEDFMKDERMKVLQMLEDGKISVDDAQDLLVVLGKSEKGQNYKSIEIDTDKVNEKMNQFAAQVDSFAKDFSGKAQDMYKDMEPKLKYGAKAVIEKTAALVDEVSKNLNENIRKMEEEAAQKQDQECCNETPPSDVVYTKPEDENKN